MRSDLRRIVGFTWVLALVSAIAWTAPQQDQYMGTIRTAEQMVQQQRPDEALAELQKIFDQTDTYGPAYFVAGLAYFAKEQVEQAYQNMVLAAEYQPGWGQAHRMASMYAADMGNLDDSWDQAIKAHLAGTDMSDAFAGLQNMGPTPEDLQGRLAAYRVVVAPMNLDQYLGTAENPFGRLADAGGNANDTNNVSNSKATGVPARVVSQSSADRAAVLRRTRARLADSRQFGLVGNQAQAQLILVIDVEELGESATNRPLRGHFNLIDARSGEQVHRIRVEMRNIASDSDINRDLDRIIGLLEEWAEEQQR